MFKTFKNPRLRQRLAAFVALSAIMLHAAAPITAQAMMARSGAMFIALCTAHGIVQVEVASEFGEPTKVAPAQPCSLCILSAAPPPPLAAFFGSTFNFKSLANALFVSLDGTSLVFASVVQHHAPPTGPPSPSFA